jgi:hypothetical protein
MLPFYCKRIGLFVIILSFVLFLSIMFNFSPFSLFTDAYVGVFKWIGLSGLILVTISKEKNETVEIERLRFHCFFRNFFGCLLIVVVFSLSNLLVTHDKVSIEKALGYLKDNDVSKFSFIFLSVHFFTFRKELRKMSNTP